MTTITIIITILSNNKYLPVSFIDIDYYIN